MLRGIPGSEGGGGLTVTIMNLIMTVYGYWVII